MNYEYLDNAFWEADDRSIVKCIRLTKVENGPANKRKKDVMQFHKLLPNGTECPNYKEVVEKVGIEKIDQNTAERRERKEREAQQKRAVHEQKKRTVELEKLFNLKLQAFEIDEIKNSTDRALRTKIRRAKNEVEMNALAAILCSGFRAYQKPIWRAKIFRRAVCELHTFCHRNSQYSTYVLYSTFYHPFIIIRKITFGRRFSACEQNALWPTRTHDHAKFTNGTRFHTPYWKKIICI